MDILNRFATNIFVPDKASACVLFFRLLSFRLSVMLSKQTFFDKLSFSLVQSIFLKSLPSSLLSVNTLFVTFSCKISLSVFLRGSLLPSSNCFISLATRFPVFWMTPSYFFFFERFLNFFHVFARLFSSCCLNFKCFSSSCLRFALPVVV